MRLTETIRQAYVRAVMDDVPLVDYNEMARALVRKTFLNMMPKEVQALAAKADTASWLNTYWCSLPFPLSQYKGIMPGDNFSIEAKLPVVWKKLESLASDELAQRKQRNELETKLEGCARAATTRKMLADLLPEFEKYLPSDEGSICRTLPAVANVVADFAKAGWPKSKRKIRAVEPETCEA